MILYLTWKNFIVYRKRYFLLVSIVSFSVFFFIVMQSFMNGMLKGNQSGIIDFEMGHILLSLEKKQSERLLPSFPFNPDLIQKIEKNPEIQAITPRFTLTGQIALEESYYPLFITAIDPEKEKEVFRWMDHTSQNHIIQGDEAVIGIDLMKTLNLKINDSILIRFQKPDHSFVSHRFIIKEVMNTSSFQLNLQSIFVHRNTIRSILGTDEIQSYHIRLKDKKKTQTILNWLQKTQPQLVSTPWNQFAEKIEESSKSKNKVSYMMSFMILILAMLGIMNSELINFYHIRKNMTMLRILGLTKNEISWFFIFEGMWIGIVGVLCGVILGILVDFYMIYVGLDVMQYVMDKGNSEMLAGTGFPIGRIYGSFNLETYFFISAFAIFISMIGGILPGIKAKKLNLQELN